MSRPGSTGTPCPGVATANLQDLFDQIGAETELSPDRRQHVHYALRTVSRWLGDPLTAIPASGDRLQMRLRVLDTGALSSRTQSNVLWHLNFALARYGLSERRIRLSRFSLEWEGLRERVTDAEARIALSAFMRFCSANGIRPQDVDEAASQRFARTLEERRCVWAHLLHQRMCRAWNDAAVSIDGWPAIRLPYPLKRVPYGLPWEHFPETLRRELDTWFGARPDDLLPAKEALPRVPKASSIALHRDLLRRYVSALVHCGHAVEAIDSLAYLVRPAHVRQGLEWFIARAKDKPTAHAVVIAYVLRTLALHAVEMETKDRKEVLRLYCRLRRHVGRSSKAWDTVRRFDDPQVVARFLAFPAERIAEVCRGDRGLPSQALRVQAAVVLELWTFAPMHLANFTRLRLDRHLAFRRGGRLLIRLPAAEVANRRDLTFEVPGPVASHVRLYVDRFRPRLAIRDNPWLFPTRDGNAKHDNTLREQFKWAAREAVGFPVTPQQVRHVVAKLFLEQRPDDRETISRVLGQTSSWTAQGYRTGTDTKTALRHYDQAILGLEPSSVGVEMPDHG